MTAIPNKTASSFGTGLRNGSPVLASLSAFCAAWMVLMASRYFAQSAGDLRGGLGIGADDGSWLTTAYATAEPIGVVFGCWLAIGISIRRALLPAITLFLLASLAPGFVPTFGVAVAARGLMGLAAGAILPLSNLTQLRVFSLAWRPLGIAIYASATTLAPQIAASVGSFAVQLYGWQAILWASLPLGMMALLAGSAGLWLEPIRWRPIVDADLSGLASLSAGLALLACGLSQGDRLRWSDSPMVLVLLLGGGVCLALFFIGCGWRGIRDPVVLLRLARRWNLALGALVILPFQFASVLSNSLVPNFLSTVQGFRAEQIAPVLLAAAWTQFVSYPAAVLALRFHLVDARTLIVIGLSLVGLAAVSNGAVTVDWMEGELLAGQILQGIGLPLIILPLLVLFVGEVKPAEGAHAASIFNIARSITGTAVAAWVATTMRLGAQASYGELLVNTGFYPDGRRGVVATVTDAIAFASGDPGRTHLRTIQMIAAEARSQAAVLGTSETFMTLGVLLFVFCGLVLMMAEFGSGHPDRKTGPDAS